MAADERTPLLTSATPEPELTSSDSLPPPTTQPQRTTTRWLRLPTKRPSRRLILLTTLSVILITFAITFPILYCVYIPRRLQEGANGGAPDVKLFQIVALRNESVDVRVQAVVHNKDVPPIDVIMEPCLYSIRGSTGKVESSPDKKDEKIEEPQALIGSMQFPGLVTPHGVQDVDLDFASSLDALNVTYIRNTLDGLVMKTNNDTKVFAIEATPVMRIPHLGSWVIQMGNKVVVNPTNTTTPDTTPYNPRLINGTYTITTTPQGYDQIHLFANTSFTNPTPLSILPQNISLSFSLYYKHDRVLDVSIPSSTLSVAQGENTNKTVYAESVPENTFRLFQLLEEYSEGKTNVVVVRRIGLGYDEGRRGGALEWVEEMVGAWEIEVELPGAKEGQNGGGGGGVGVMGVVGDVWVEMAKGAKVKGLGRVGGWVGAMLGL
ncbi:hypothetical protein HDV00_004949 [Rhizophlyctis rosea]|nr:hypothetical protein HDV00_004949 [Rhizophlyctis rosea]